MRPGCAAKAVENSSQAGSAPIIASNSFPLGPSSWKLMTSTAFASSSDRLLFLSVSVVVGSQTSKLRANELAQPKVVFRREEVLLFIKTGDEASSVPFARPRTLSFGALTVTSRSLWA